MLLNLGTNFAPDHLEEMFEDPRMGIERIEMRFRPYVEQASYYQFLAGESSESSPLIPGSYFDTSLETMSRRWPEIPSFTHLSIVQDLPPRMTVPSTRVSSVAPSHAPTILGSVDTSAVNSLASSVADLALEHSDSEESTPPTSIDLDPPEKNVSKGYTGHGPFPYLPEKLSWAKPKTFAQPIVFFDIKCLARFGTAPVAANLTHLRLRVPSRDVAHVLIGSDRFTNPFPSLRYLDISTTNVRLDSVLSALLKAHDRLEHLVLDRVNLFGFMARDKGVELCHDLGGLCVTAGLNRGKERERAIAAWDQAERARIVRLEAEHQRRQAQLQASAQTASETPEEVAAREALAREVERERAIALARSRRGHRSAAQANFSLRDRPARTTRVGATSSVSSTNLPPPDKAYFVLPPLPTLKTMSIGGEAHHIPSARIAEWEDDFNAGWRDGLGKVLGWATHTAEKYERAKKKADEWFASQGAPVKTASKGKSKAAPAVKTKPPTNIKLFRFPRPDEPRIPTDADDPTSGLIEVYPDGRDFLDVYRSAMADAELYATSHANPPPCILCTVPDCEGPARKGMEGERLDGRGGSSGKHREGCGHLYGRAIWGWDGQV